LKYLPRRSFNENGFAFTPFGVAAGRGRVWKVYWRAGSVRGVSPVLGTIAESYRGHSVLRGMPGRDALIEQALVAFGDHKRARYDEDGGGFDLPESEER
jgi:hypothetical protein